MIVRSHPDGGHGANLERSAVTISTHVLRAERKENTYCNHVG